MEASIRIRQDVARQGVRVLGMASSGGGLLVV